MAGRAAGKGGGGMVAEEGEAAHVVVQLAHEVQLDVRRHRHQLHAAGAEVVSCRLQRTGGGLLLHHG